MVLDFIPTLNNTYASAILSLAKEILNRGPLQSCRNVEFEVSHISS